MSRYTIVLGVILGLVTAETGLASEGVSLSVEIVGPSEVWCSAWQYVLHEPPEGEPWVDEIAPTYSQFGTQSNYDLPGDIQEEVGAPGYSLCEEWWWDYGPACVDTWFDWPGFPGVPEWYDDGSFPYIYLYCPGGAGTYNTLSVTYRLILAGPGGSRTTLGEATDSIQYRVLDWITTRTIERNPICAGAIDSPVHQTVIGVDISNGFDPLVGGEVYQYISGYAYCNTPPSFDSQWATTDSNGHAEFVLTSGDAADTVEIGPEYRAGPQWVTFALPAMSFAIVDPETDEPLDYFLADGEAQLRVVVTETQGEMPVDGHALTWRFRFWDIEKDPDVDEPDYVGTGEAPYGSVSPVNGTTDAAGRHYTIYTSATVDGWVEFEAIDGSVYEWN